MMFNYEHLVIRQNIKKMLAEAKMARGGWLSACFILPAGAGGAKWLRGSRFFVGGALITPWG